MRVTTEPVAAKKISILATLSSMRVFIVVVLALLVGGWLIYINSQQDNTIISLQDQLIQQQLQLEKLNQQSAAHIKQIEALHNNVADINSQLNQGKQADALRRYQFGNIERFIRFANQVLLLEQDVNKARRLLESADAEIAQVNDPALHDVHEQIAHDIAALNAVPVVKVDDLFTQLSALIEQVEKLTVAPTLQFVPTDATAPTVEQAASTLNTILNWLSQYIKIQKHENVATPLLTPQEAAFVKHNIVVLLEQAQWGLLRYQAHAYQASLERAEKLVTQYGAKNDATVKAFLDNIAALKALNIAPPLPDISASLPLLEKVAAPTPHSDAP